MGLCADIIAIGPFDKSIAKHLHYPTERYAATREGVPVLTELFGIYEGTTLSNEFARLVGVFDPWDFNQHGLNVNRFDWKGLQEFVSVYSDYDEELVKLRSLAKAGFSFYFRPNG